MTEDATWTLHELVDEVARVLRGYDAAENRQIRPVPDVRAIRYYASLGLLDRPAAMRGRTALYGRRHLAQLVAIKRLQAAGRSLAEVQAVLPGLDDAALARASGVEVPLRQAPAPGRAGFWRQAPTADRAARAKTFAARAEAAPPAADRAEITAAAPAAAPAPREPTVTARPEPAAPVRPAPAAGSVSATTSTTAALTDAAPPTAFTERLVLELAPGVTVLIDPARAPTVADADAARLAGEALVAELRRRHLVAPAGDR